MKGLTKRESRVLRMIRRGAEASRDRDRPHLIVLQHPDIKTFRTAEYMVRRLQHRGLVVRGDNMLALELTQEGIASLTGSRHEGKSTLPAGLLPLARTKAMAKLQELRREGFADPVDALLGIAFEDGEDGEWAHPIETRIQCLTAAAPYCRPKLQAIIAKIQGGGGKSHAEWLADLKEEIEGTGSDVIEGQSKEIN